MKKTTYSAPAITIVKINAANHLMEVSIQSVSGLEGVTLSTDAFTGGNADVKSNYSVWDDDWSAE